MRSDNCFYSKEVRFMKCLIYLLLLLPLLACATTPEQAARMQRAMSYGMRSRTMPEIATESAPPQPFFQQSAPSYNRHYQNQQYQDRQDVRFRQQQEQYYNNQGSQPFFR